MCVCVGGGGDGGATVKKQRKLSMQVTLIPSAVKRLHWIMSLTHSTQWSTVKYNDRHSFSKQVAKLKIEATEPVLDGTLL